MLTNGTLEALSASVTIFDADRGGFIASGKAYLMFLKEIFAQNI
jgi:hypothetical protein